MGQGSGAYGSKVGKLDIPAPGRECMEEELDEAVGPGLGLVVKEFSVYSLLPVPENIEGAPLKTAAVTAAGTTGKVLAYKTLSKSASPFAKVAADGLHLFGEYAAIPITLASTGLNGYIANKCTCEQRTDPFKRERLRQYREEAKYWNNTYRPATQLGF